MRAKTWLGPFPAVLLGTMLAGGCAQTSSTPQGIAETGDGAYTLATRGPTAASAVERGLNQASQHCADQNRMIAVQSTRIERDGYNIAFRCLSVPGASGGVEMAAAAPAVTATPAVTAAPAVMEAPASAAPSAEAPAAPAPAVVTEALPATPAQPAAAPATTAVAVAARPVTPSGTQLPTATSALPPIAGSGASGGGFTRPTSGLAPSTFWQAGR